MGEEAQGRWVIINRRLLIRDNRDAGRAPSRPSGTAMISERRNQRVPGSIDGRLGLLTAVLLVSTIAGAAWTDNPTLASGE
ncbi:hypothetical protein KM043_018343 [Ampulex compressa]|nr:hypothetical protein KM043_018343 [Ampulex compressa]